MKIQLSQIKPSPKPIRSSWDEEKMNELAESIKEQGLIVPIKVRPLFKPCKWHGLEWFETDAERVDELVNCMGCDDMLRAIYNEETDEDEPWYEIVYGHRRVEATRRAGLEEIECVVEETDEKQSLKESYIENMIREGMEDIDISNALHEIAEKEGVRTSRELAKLGYGSERTIGRYYRVSEQPASVIERFHRQPGIEPLTSLHLDAVTETGLAEHRGIKGQQGGRTASIITPEGESVLEKAHKENLTVEQTRKVAEAIRDAPTPEIKKKVLEVPIISRDTSADILRRSVNRYEMETGIKAQEEMSEWQKEREERREMQEWDFAVKEFLDATKLYEQVARKGSALVKYGKFSPEAARFAMRKIDALIGILKTYKEELETVK